MKTCPRCQKKVAQDVFVMYGRCLVCEDKRRNRLRAISPSRKARVLWERNVFYQELLGKALR